MNKVCPRCRVIVAGGAFCPDCGTDVPLLDVADPRNKEYVRGQGGNIRQLYAARLTMLRFFIGLLLGGVAAVLLVRHGSAFPSPWRYAFWLVALVVLLLGTFGFAPLTRWLQRRAQRRALRGSKWIFSKGWAKRALRARRS